MLSWDYPGRTKSQMYIWLQKVRLTNSAEQYKYYVCRFIWNTFEMSVISWNHYSRNREYQHSPYASVLNITCHNICYFHTTWVAWRSGLHVWLVICASPIKGPRCFLEQETLPLLLSTGWFQERIRAWFHNRTKVNWGPYGRLT